MLLDWPIRTKLKLGLGLLLVTVLALFGSAYYGLYAYRELVRSLSARATELPLASDVLQHVGDLRVSLSQANDRVSSQFVAAGLVAEGTDGRDASNDPFTPMLDRHFRSQLSALVEAVNAYRTKLEESPVDGASQLSDDRGERTTLAQIDQILADLADQELEPVLGHESQILSMLRKVEHLQVLATELPNHLHTRMRVLSHDVRAQYRTAIIAAWCNVGIAVVVLAAAKRVFYKWFADPLQVLVAGSRQVAAGNFAHRIQLQARDELGELADAMNAMTDGFREIRDDLDRQVQERTSQVVRSEQLASVGCLAAGVSHEINNPLASIALCSESLEGRLQELLEGAPPERADDVKIVRNYLQMIQREAFRCKQITEKLLDFARRGDSQRHTTDLRELAEGVLEMVQHLGQYQDKHLTLAPGPPALAAVNPQEMKQVVLNLVTNALESVDAGGRVSLTVDRQGDRARFVVEDDGCGMTEEVRKHLFEPFFTRRRSGQGTGLGLSITHRIIAEHRGQIDATSDGPGRGSRFVVSLPALVSDKEVHHRRQAA
ncbi:MAG TPA: HAMP domain-containing sensor histidine kinase [Lacipirellulaceae bacterium]|nr:HAMP domain-containing sensor histidine kinase [Lacipirellulaceae bacterium]